MEKEMREHLLACGSAYATAAERTLSTVGRLCANDGGFFKRITDGKPFSARVYDQVMGWFSSNWPADADWPAAVPRPAAVEEAEAA